jgi:hypothetical protein
MFRGIMALRIFLCVCVAVVAVSCGEKREGAPPLYSDVDTVAFKKGDVVYPFSYIDPSQKGWKIVIEISGDDLNDLSTRVPGSKLSTTKPSVLGLVKEWKFTYEGGDLATVTSSVLVYRNGTLVDQQGIVLDQKLVGLQSIKYGWISPVDTNQIYRTIQLMDEKIF